MEIIDALMTDEVRARAFDVVAGIAAAAWLARVGATGFRKAWSSRTANKVDDRIADGLDAFASGLEWLSNALGSLPILPRKR